MGLRDRLERLERDCPEPARNPLPPEMTARELAAAILARRVRAEDVPRSDPRLVEAVTRVFAIIGAAQHA